MVEMWTDGGGEKPGRMVNISSIGAFNYSGQGAALYSITKAGVNRMTETLAVVGKGGTGKTTICRCLLEHVPDNVDLALVLNPKVTAYELIATVCDELGIDYPRENSSIKTQTDVLNRYLL